MSTEPPATQQASFSLIGQALGRLVWRLLTLRASPEEVRIKGDCAPLLIALFAVCALCAWLSSLIIGDWSRIFWRLVGCGVMGAAVSFTERGRRVVLPGAWLISAGIDLVTAFVVVLLQGLGYWGSASSTSLMTITFAEFVALGAFIFKAHHSDLR